MKNRNIILATILLTLGSLALPQRTQAVETAAPDTALAGGNTADGQGALLSLTTGLYNSAFGLDSLLSNGAANFNTGVGAGALLSNTADFNTATGAAALFSNTIGSYNTADGVFALFSNTEGHDNTATGDYALFGNTAGSNNTALGRLALYNNTTGSENTALGIFAGHDLTTGDNNIDIGNNVVGIAGESNTIRIGNTDITDTFIRGISGATAAGGDAVFVTSGGRLGTLTSSARFKDEIKPMGTASEAILTLRPVSFRYKKQIDPQGIPEYGLIAEEVAKVNPALITRDREGKPYTVRYEQINAMLLNEFLKEHRTVQELRNEIAALTSTVKEQASQIQKVSAQVELNKPTPRTVAHK